MRHSVTLYIKYMYYIQHRKQGTAGAMQLSAHTSKCDSSSDSVTQIRDKEQNLQTVTVKYNTGLRDGDDDCRQQLKKRNTVRYAQ